MWEMAIRIPDGQWGIHIEILVKKVIPVISILKEECGVEWYCFLIHNNDNGVPIPSYDGIQFHVRFENSTLLPKEKLSKLLPGYCEKLRKDEQAKSGEISGIDIDLLKNRDISEAWRRIGEFCEWVVEMINAHELDDEIQQTKIAQQISQFFHFVSNITQLRTK
jgi:hypothetical protein